MLVSNSSLIRLWLPMLCLGAAFSLLLVAGCDSMITPLDTYADGVAMPSTSTAGSDHEVILLSDDNSAAFAVNDAGVVAGALNISGVHHAVRWTVDHNGNVTGQEELGSMPAPFEQYIFQRPRAINSEGLIVGEVVCCSPNRQRAFLYDTEMRALSLFVGNTYNSSARHINNQGAVVGEIEYALRDEDDAIMGREMRAAVWFPPYEDLPTLLPPLADNEHSSAMHISEAGVVTGFSYTKDESGFSRGEAVYWQLQEDGGASLPLIVVGTDKHYPRPGSINEAGDLLTRSGLLRSGIVYELEPLAGDDSALPFALNNPDAEGRVKVAGWSLSSQPDRPVYWTVSATSDVGGPVELSLPGNRFMSAQNVGISNNGWMVGYSNLRRGQRATLWMPSSSAGDPDPPPSGDGPTASFDYNCGNSPTCQFTDTSTEGGAAIESRDWVTGSQTASGSQVSFTFGTAGDHVVTLTVTDAEDASDQASQTVKCRDHRVHGLRCS